jgi:DNA-binding NarL/FixJ family response regulator
MLLAIYSMLRDYGILQPGGAMVSADRMTQQHELHTGGEVPLDLEERFDAFSRRVTTLTSAERRIFNYYIQGCEIADIPSLAYISINTVKKHNRSIYQKLDVVSRDELMVYIEQFRLCGRLGELTGDAVEAG